MRRGATSTSRALAEQATASDQIVAATNSLNGLIASVNQAMSEQASAAVQVSVAANNMRRETEQASKSLAKQTHGLKDMVAATQNTARQLTLITHANLEHSTAAGRLLEQLRNIRQVTDRNARDVRETKSGTVDLLRHAQELTGFIETRQPRGGRSNGHSGSNGKRKAANGRG